MIDKSGNDIYIFDISVFGMIFLNKIYELWVKSLALYLFDDINRYIFVLFIIANEYFTLGYSVIIIYPCVYIIVIDIV